MSKNLLNSLIMVCCLLIVGISSAFALKGINGTYAATSCLAYFYSNGGEWLIKDTTSDYKVIPYNDKFYLNSDKIKISKNGCEFGGWAIGSATGERVTSSYVNNCSSAIKYYATWINCVQKYTVSFNLNGASGSIDSQTINSGGKVSNPGSPTRNGYTFLYWSKSSDGSKYDFNTKVTGSFTLYARWKENVVINPTPQPTPQPQPTPSPQPQPAPQPSVTKYTISFDLNGGTGNISSQSIEKGGKVSKPDDPTIGNGVFVGWASDKQCNNEYNFNSTVNSNITLYACYSKNYKITFNRQGLPFINIYSNDVLEGSNLHEYNNNFTAVVVDSTTYSSSKEKSCTDVLKNYYNNLSSTKLKEKCNKIDRLLNCSLEENCYAGKYVFLEDNDKEEVIYLKNNGAINLEYSIYKYTGLYKDKECKNEYSYSSSIKNDLELYECFELTDEDIDEPIQNPKKKKGISATLILVIIAFLSVIVFVGYLFFKGKIANKVD